MLLVANRKLDEATSQNRDLMQVISKREETIHNNQVRLEEKSRECSILTRQLEEALEDARRQVRLLKHSSPKNRNAVIIYVTQKRYFEKCVFLNC